MEHWWQQDKDTVAKALNSHLDKGLTTQQLLEQHQKYGPNELQQGKSEPAWKLFLSQFTGFMVWVLLGAAVISAFSREWADVGIILAIVLLNGILGFVQEFRAEKSLNALKQLASPMSKVIRNGRHHVVPSAELVPGDLIELEAGDNIPADGRVVWLTSHCAVQEASLTGESTAVSKSVAPLQRDAALADRVNMVYMGTSVSNGRARVLVTATGMDTELGRIAEMMDSIEEEMTPLQKKLEHFGKVIVTVCLVLVAMVFALGMYHGETFKESLIIAVSLAVAAIPEGLPAVVTIALALGVQRMVKRHALIRKLPSVETLGCTTVICSDKTGTLTRNEMTVQSLYTGHQWFQVTGTGYQPEGQFQQHDQPIQLDAHPDLVRTLHIGVLCNGAQLMYDKGQYQIMGDPTEGCLLTAGAKAALLKKDLDTAYPFVDEIAFDSERKKMTVIRQDGHQRVAYCKGAPDQLIRDCSHIQCDGVVRLLTDQDRETLLGVNNELADQAMRVLGAAYRPLDDTITDYTVEHVEKNLIFAGLFGVMDPPREEVKVAIAQCQRAGIRPVMITGDHKNTAVAIARQLGFFDDSSLALSGDELDTLSDEQLKETVSKIAVYARVTPAHKLRVVRAWRALGQVIAMTGDGVNDAPAVKEADIGVAMGITGTDVTKEVSDMVITDDNYASIVAAVEEGRGVYDNIRKFVHYLLSCNTGEILLMFAASLFGMPAPLLAIHILWVNLVTDGLPALALGVEKIDANLMNRPPRPPAEPVVTKRGGLLMIAQGLLMATCALITFYVVLNSNREDNLARARTFAFVTLACSQLFHSFNCRSLSQSLFKIGPLGNPQLIIATSISFLVQVAVVHVPLLRGWFKTEALSLQDWAIILAIASIPLWAVEIGKLIKGRFLIPDP
ncbi:MAG: calcium-translocating P-type ATPase, SERCA-type [Phycisphaerae bacterium]|nr:calcium-translocating P-type ATPase, SERCA-type [Phycisphaerae bacterium]